MLSTIRQFNNSKRVCALYGMVFATLIITAPVTCFGLLLIFGDSESGWAKFGGIWLTALGLGLITKSVPEFIKEYKDPSSQPDEPMNLWLPIVLTLSCLVFAYAEYGEHGKTVKGWMVDGLLGMITTVLPFTSDAVDMMYEFEQFKVECLDAKTSFGGKELDSTIVDSEPKC
ncbi:hypothetical protein [Vibrio anguillarum]|uniref:hypothetical protein n=1 Tax=Vibrio anguillarum TaxID=55601 RepID=UPI0016BA6697|nr:hypothetical protein [Vibrio anguillarum]NOI07225.1 hypothetical protein [Vibrio anguillarum]